MNRGQLYDIIGAVLILFLVSSVIYAGMLRPFKIVVSDSMEPTIHGGDIVYVVSPRGPIKKGDIVIYTRPDYMTPILHRVIKVETTTINGTPTECYIIKGDNNPAPDPPYPLPNGKALPCVPRSAIIGKEVYVIPKIGKLFLPFYD